MNSHNRNFHYPYNLGSLHAFGLGGIQEKTEQVQEYSKKVDQVATTLKKLADVAKKVGQAFSKLGIGGVKDDRFIKWRDKILAWFIQYGYGTQNETGLTVSKFGIDHSQVPDKKSNGNYGAEFQNLRKYVIARLNYKNPGLGDDWGTLFPEIRMFDLGGPVDQPFTALYEILKAVPPGQYKKGTLLDRINNRVESEKIDASKADMGWVSGGLLLLVIGGTYLATRESKKSTDVTEESLKGTATAKRKKSKK